MDNGKREADYIAALAHDLRSPLVTVKGFASALLDGTALEDKREEYLRLIVKESDRMADMVEGLFELSKLEGAVVEMCPFSLTECVRLAVIAVDKRIEDKGLCPVVELEEVTVKGNRPMTERVLTNLFDNALKFVPQGGRLWVKVQKRPDGGLFEIGNSGVPIPAEDLPHVFDKYYKKGKNGGAGLGLYLVKTALEKQGATITVRSDTEGTVFSFCMPC